MWGINHSRASERRRGCGRSCGWSWPLHPCRSTCYTALSSSQLNLHMTLTRSWSRRSSSRASPSMFLTLNATQFQDQVGAPVPFGTHFPSQWPDVPQLQETLQKVQENTPLWTNLSNSDCRNRYGTEVYTNFRTIVLAANWTQSLPPNNSALAIGALPGQPGNGNPDRFMSLCPAAYLSVTSGSFIPNTTVYIELADEHQCTGGGSMPASCGEDPDVLDASYDLCFYYRPEGRVGTIEWDINKQLALSYCLSEPLEGTSSRLVFSRLVTQILAVAIGKSPCDDCGLYLRARPSFARVRRSPSTSLEPSIHKLQRRSH